MATRGRPLPAATVRQIQQLRQVPLSIRKTAHEAQVATKTVQKYQPKPA